jgi:tungstate transport system ATP-binding protein
MSTNAPIYQLRQLVQRYGAREVVRVDELDIPRGEIFCLVGPNGAGKSSLLRLLNFLEMRAAGQLTFDGQEINGHVSLALRRRVTMVFQKPLLLHGTVQANVAYGLRVRGERDADRRALEVLDIVGMRSFAHVTAKTLSGGEAQRVALARAIIVAPEVLLLDEPTANLDPYNGALIERIVRDLNQARGTTVVMVTHNIFQARRLAHRVALLFDGKVIEVGETESFFTAPRDPRAAAFVRGEMVF